LKRHISLSLTLSAITLFSAGLLNAQQAQPQDAPANKTVTAEQAYDANVQLMRQDLRSKRKQLVAANLPLTDTEVTKFWPLYDKYIAETVKVNDDRYSMIKQYAQGYETLTQAQAADYIRRWLALDQRNTELRLKYIPEFEKVISNKKTATLFQIDRRVGMMIELQLASEIPLVQP